MNTALVATLGLLALGTQIAEAQQPAPARQPGHGLDPNPFMQGFFGKETPEERARAEAVKLSWREENAVGEAALRNFRTQLARRDLQLVSRGKDIRYLRELVDRIRPLMKHASRYRRIRVLLVESEETDARSFPGGTVVVFAGLIDFCESEAALVGILGHELSHFDRGHQLYHAKRWKLMQQSFEQGFDPSRFAELGGTMAKMFTRPFRPEEETQADNDGVRWAYALRYDPREMARVFHRLKRRDPHKPQFTPNFLRSHPFHDDRFRAILRQSHDMMSTIPAETLYLGRQNLHQRTTRFDREFPDESVR